MYFRVFFNAKKMRNTCHNGIHRFDEIPHNIIIKWKFNYDISIMELRVHLGIRRDWHQYRNQHLREQMMPWKEQIRPILQK